jgi:hypothetical protein
MLQARILKSESDFFSIPSSWLIRSGESTYQKIENLKCQNFVELDFEILWNWERN